jgi:hypothetical protein
MRGTTGRNNLAWLRTKLIGATLAIVLLTGSRLSAADWARDMFEVTRHDFGTVAAHAKAEFSFRFTNKYLYEVRVASVRSSCSCSDVRVTQNSLAAYESGEIVASILSERLRGDQSSTLTVIFDKPRYAEVQLRLTVFIRGDVLIEPAGFDFGEVEHGADALRKVTVTHFGAADWKIVDVLASTDFVECELGKPVRSGNRVSYPLTAWLTASAPPGDLRTQLLLVTSDPRAEKIPVMVEGSIRPPVSVSPASLYLGSLRPGESVTKRLVARASKPFRILQIGAECDCFEFTYSADEAKMLHLIPVKFTAGDAPGRVKRTIEIKTDLNGARASIVTWAAVDEQAK